MSRFKKMVDTRRLYCFENTYLTGAYLQKPRSLRFLKTLAEKVWAKHGRKHVRVPSIAIVEGAKWSSCTGYSEIALATATSTRRNVPHNTVDVLIHELTHAMGFGNPHGPGFARKYVELLVEYGRCHEGELKLAMRLFNIKH